LAALVAAIVSLLVFCPAGAGAEPVVDHLRLVAPAAPGGGWDQTARAMQAALQAAGVVRTSSVENIPGAAGTIGLARFISAERGSGDVLMMSGLIMLGAVVTHHSPVTLRQVTPIARLIGEFEVIVVPAASPYRTLADLIAAFRAAPESISWGGGSAGGTDEILAGLFAEAVGVAPSRVNYIAFSGGGESLSAILGGQVSAGVNGLAELAPHIESGAVRALAISSAERLPNLDSPTLIEQGVDVVIENWRSVVAPPGISAAERERLERVVEAMVESREWRETLVRYRWTDRHLAGTAFARFAAAEEARVEGILARIGTGPSAAEAAPHTMGRYPAFVLIGLALTALWSADGLIRSRARGSLAAGSGARPWHAMALVAAAAAIDLALLDTAGFVIASSALFWLTARAFDATRPLRDAIFAIAVSVASYVVFVRLLQLSLPPGLLAGWL
jgi:putative tricarboxylic transport membrane protein